MCNLLISLRLDFGHNRDTVLCREEHVNNSCFVCGVDRHEFEKVVGSFTNGFAFHREKTHNLLYYIYFVVHIWDQDIQNDDGVESFVRKSMEMNDVSWFPSGITRHTINVTRSNFVDADSLTPIASGPSSNGHGAPTSVSLSHAHSNSSHSHHPNPSGAASGGDKDNALLLEKLSTLQMQMSALMANKMEEKLVSNNLQFEPRATVDAPPTGGSRNDKLSTVHRRNDQSSATEASDNVLETMQGSIEMLGSQVDRIIRRLDRLNKKIDDSERHRANIGEASHELLGIGESGGFSTTSATSRPPGPTISAITGATGFGAVKYKPHGRPKTAGAALSSSENPIVVDVTDTPIAAPAPVSEPPLPSTVHRPSQIVQMEGSSIISSENCDNEEEF